MSEPGIQTLLVATDFSATAQIGIDWGVELARLHGARIVLMHGLLLPNRATDFVPSPPDFTEVLQEAASGRLNGVAESIRAKGVEVETDLRLGVPSQAILEAAEEKEAALVVIGTRGLTGLKHLLLGSTAARVVQHAECPVLTVHSGDLDRHRRIRSLLVPTDFSRNARIACRMALRILGPDASAVRLLLLHVYHLPYEYTAYGTIPTSVDYFRDVQGAAEEKLEELAATFRELGVEVETRAREGYPPEIIVEEAAAAGADLIAMGTHGRTGVAHLLLGSTAERVMQHAECPVLTVRRPEDEA